MKNILDTFWKPLENNFLKWLEKQLKPPVAFSPQTLILLSLFSLVMGILATGFTKRFIIACGWMFFISGTAWLMNEKPLRINHYVLNYWISGIIICLFVFGYVLEELERLDFWVTLPMVVILIQAISDFTDQNLNFYIPNVATRQKLVMLLGVHLLISCWLQFFFMVNNFLNDYSILVREDFTKSAFVIKLPFLLAPADKGELILSSVLAPVKVKLNNQPWPEVESLLQSPDRDIWIKSIGDAVIGRLSPAKENSFWKVNHILTPEDSGYSLELFSFWEGPSSSGEGIRFTSKCEIKRVDTSPINPPINPSPKPPINSLTNQFPNLFIKPPTTRPPNPSPNSSNTSPNRINPQSGARVSSTSKIECQQIVKTRRRL